VTWTTRLPGSPTLSTLPVPKQRIWVVLGVLNHLRAAFSTKEELRNWLRKIKDPRIIHGFTGYKIGTPGTAVRVDLQAIREDKT